ncbi:MAG TPA: sialate O-acetylesterase [Opitutaceae bacterium]|nr:sialate O-acetylesterase [Opitutaceae bacterium]
MFKRLSLLAALLPLGSRADVALAPLFTDHAVLQQDKAVPVWGQAAPGETVTVTFRDQSVCAVAGKDGRWIVYLDPLQPGAPAELVVSGKNTLKVQDVVVGEVWMCSGQSNMEFRVWGPKGDVYRVDNADEEVAAAQLPLIRHFKVERAVAAEPADAAKGTWVVCSPDTVGQFTAVGYFFARDLAQRLGVPIGLINVTWGGTAIESWLSAAALQSDPAFAVVDARWNKALIDWPAKVAAYEAARAAQEKDEAVAKAAGPAKYAEYLKSRAWLPPPPSPTSPDAPRSLFNGMINPLLPYALRGVLWYQGESNDSRPTEYHALFAALITFWRAHWGQGDFPFYFVQLPNYAAGNPAGNNWAWLREAQAQALSLPNTGMAVTIDIGDPGDAHPRNKQEVGRRLALIARHQGYGIPGDWCGPVFKSAEREGTAMRVHFAHAEAGLVAHDKPLTAFVIAGADRQFHPAATRIERDTVLVSAPEVREPVAVRYAWTNAPEANLFNGAGLPAAPFRTDDW